MPPSFRPFTWMDADALAACVYPQSDLELAELAGLGVSLLINLHERSHQKQALARHGLDQLHLPVRDLTAPAPDQINVALEAIESALAEGRKVVVHCAVGLGRTGTIMACYFVKLGMDPSAAITRVRSLRPGSIESEVQIQAIHDFARDDNE